MVPESLASPPMLMLILVREVLLAEINHPQALNATYTCKSGKTKALP